MFYQHNIRSQKKERSRKIIFIYCSSKKHSHSNTKRMHRTIINFPSAPPLLTVFSSFSVFKSNMKKIPFKSTAHRRSKRKLLKTEFKVKFNLKNFSLSLFFFLFHFTRCSNRKREMERKKHNFMFDEMEIYCQKEYFVGCKQ